ncbi:MAG: peroxidase-related enzyme [Thermomicrobiales bacterium]|nr:peroxidase-related enzyme [Thermomicrobiales bacterium]
MSNETIGWTVEMLEWAPWLETIHEAGHTRDEVAAIEEAVPVVKGSRYFATLAHDLPALRERTALFSNAMRSAGGASNAERELAAVVTSRINGCVYCASVHARAYNVYARKPAVIEEIYAEGVDTPIAAADVREQVIINFSAKLTRDHSAMTAADLAPLRAAGLTDLEILDVTQAAAMFAWANRLMLTLGEPERIEP